MKLLIVFVLLLVLVNGYDNGFLRTHSSCVNIPSDLKLCYGVGYDEMVLPNLLKHETLYEVKQQASSFVPLLSQNCHPHAQVFLCSLFAPVCLTRNTAVDGAIPPCRSLCKSVEASCAPIMRDYTFEWPSMLNCSNWKDVDPCVSVNETAVPATTKPVSSVNRAICAPCRAELEKESLYDNYCASEFVIKIRSKRYSQDLERGEREITADRKKRLIFKKGPLEKQDLKRMRLMVGGRGCRCPQLEGETSNARKRVPRGANRKRKNKGAKSKKRKRRKSYYLVMGRKVGQKLLVTVLYKWQKKNHVLKEALKSYFTRNTCPMFGVPGGK